jgi:serine/threonine protein kinase
LICDQCGNAILLNDRYQIIRIIQRDDRRSTDIYEAIDIIDQSKKVIKVLARYTRRDLEYFLREIQTLEALADVSNIQSLRIPLVDIDSYFSYKTRESSFTLHCIVLQKIEGQTLNDYILSGEKTSTSRAIDWLSQLVNIIHYLHSKDFIHRDIKPSNIIISNKGYLFLIDFGSARNCLSSTYRLKVSALEKSNGLPDGRDITAWISAGYTAPEQINGRATQQSDFFALGRTMVHLLTGEHPLDLFLDNSEHHVNWRKTTQNIDKPLLDLVDELIEPSVTKRPQNSEVILKKLSKLPSQIQIYKIATSVYVKSALIILVIGSIIAFFKIYILFQSNQYLLKGNEQLFDVKDYLKARTNFEKAIKYNPKNIDALNNLALSCESLNDDLCALNNYGQILAIKPNWSAYYNLGGFYDEKEEYKLAKINYIKSIEISKSEVAAPYNNLSRIEIISGNYAEAEKLIRAGLKLKIEASLKAALQKNMGWVYIKQGRYSEAEKILTQSVQTYPQRTDVYCLLALAYEARGKPAQKWWEPCLRSNTDDAGSREVRQWRLQILERALKG